MSGRFCAEVIECNGKDNFIIIKDELSCDYYYINHEIFEKRKSYCDALVDRLNQQDEMIKELKKQNKKHNDSINKLLDIRNFIE